VDDIGLVHPNGNDLHLITSGKGRWASCSFSPNGKKIVGAWLAGGLPGNADLYVMNLSGSPARLRTTVVSGPQRRDQLPIDRTCTPGAKRADRGKCRPEFAGRGRRCDEMRVRPDAQNIPELFGIRLSRFGRGRRPSSSNRLLKTRRPYAPEYIASRDLEPPPPQESRS
jgi:hypothetical protein